MDNTCVTNGDGTSTVCGANGPWNSIEAALDNAACAGMQAGDTLNIRGDVTRDVTCENGGVCYHEENINVHVDCSGIIIQNQEDEHVVVNGTTDISGATWTDIGSGVWECQTSECSGSIGETFAFTAWYDRGAGEERLNLEQTVVACDNTLASGMMRIDTTDQSICVHLSNDASPATATYFRVPTLTPFIQGPATLAANLTFRANPLGGSFTVTRMRERGIRAHAEDNPGWVVDGLELSWMMDRCLELSNGPGVAGTRFINNTIAFCGQEAIRLTGDTGAFEIIGNTISEVQTEPVFERCDGIGDGCRAGFTDNGTAIRIISRDGVGGVIASNTITSVGGGQGGEGRAINQENFNQNNIIENNYISDIHGNGDTGYAFHDTGSFADELTTNNIIRNNRIFDVDVCYSRQFGGAATAQTGAENWFVNNTCVNPATTGLVTEGTHSLQVGTLHITNNIIYADTGDPTLLFAGPDATAWANVQNNVFECTSCSTNKDIIDHFDFEVERPADCTSTVDCIEDWNADTAGVDANLYGDIDIDTTGTPNLHIDSDSVAYEAGQTLSASIITTDYAGTVRTAPWDVGAFEASVAMTPVEGLPTLEITSFSIGFDAGKDQTLVLDDFVGTMRPQGTNWDIGAFEVTGSAPGILTQKAFRFYGRWMDEGEQPLDAENVSVGAYTRGFLTLRIAIASSAGAVPTTNLLLFARKNAGTWESVGLADDATVGVYITDNPVRENRTVLANELTLSGDTFNASGLFIDADISNLSVSLAETRHVEFEWSLGITSGASEGDVIDLRIEESDGTDLAGYTVTPSVTVFQGRLEGTGGFFE